MPTWDDLIDEAARQLTEGQPGAGFRTRVLARLDQRPRRWSRAWLLAPAAAIAIVVATLVIPREKMGDIALSPEIAKVGLKADTTSVAVRLKADTTPSAPAPVGGRVKPDPANTPPPVEYPADVAVEPIDIAPLTMPLAVVDALATPAPLVVEGIAIAPLDTLE